MSDVNDVAAGLLVVVNEYSVLVCLRAGFKEVLEVREMLAAALEPGTSVAEW